MYASKKYWVFVVLTIVFVCIAGYYFKQLKYHGDQYKKNKNDYTRTLYFEDRVLKGYEFSLTDWGFTKRREKAETHLGFAEQHRADSVNLSLQFCFSILIYLLFALFYFAPDEHYLKFISTALVIAAMPCVLIGITYPFLEIGAFSEDLVMSYQTNVPFVDYEVKIEKEFTGRMYYYYQCKSVFDLIHILFKASNLVVALCIIVFSILMPLAKLILSLYLLMKTNMREGKSMKWFISVIGKWSMADVFVAAAFLAYLSFENMSNNEQIKTESFTLMGLYFFLGYCVLSIISSIIMEKALATINISVVNR